MEAGVSRGSEGGTPYFGLGLIPPHVGEGVTEEADQEGPEQGRQDND